MSNYTKEGTTATTGKNSGSDMFGKVQTVEPSHFKPRGHYERDEVLRAIQDVVRTQRLVQ